MSDDFEYERNHFCFNDCKKHERNGSFMNDDQAKGEKPFAPFSMNNCVNQTACIF